MPVSHRLCPQRGLCVPIGSLWKRWTHQPQHCPPVHQQCHQLLHHCLKCQPVGMAAYSSSSTIQFDLDDFTTTSSLQNAVSNVVFTGGSTNTPDALDDARLLLNPGNNRGARVNSEGIPKIAILITGILISQKSHLFPTKQ